MKSIIEQASSIMKAIEKAWDQAEQPKEFSIKIFEKEERNFFGMSTKPAKVGIFFGDKVTAHEKPLSKPRPEIKECRPENRNNKPAVSPLSRKTAENKPKAAAQKTPTSPKTSEDRGHKTHSHSEQPTPRPSAKPVQQHPHTNIEKNRKTAVDTEEKSSFTKATDDRPRRTPAAWNDIMIGTTHNWLKKTLALMGMTSIDFNSEVAGKNLKLTFNKPLITDPMHEKQLFRSFAHLIMSSLRNQYKQEIKDLKVILIRPE